MPSSEALYRKLANAVLLFTALIIGVIASLPSRQIVALTSEGGWVEGASVAVLAVGSLYAASIAWRSRKLVWCSVTLMFVWMVLRELDFQKLFTPRSVESIGFYSNPNIPFSMKLSALLVLLPFGLAGAHIAVSIIRYFRTQPGRLGAWVDPLIRAGCLIAVAVIAEKALPVRFQFIEECAELGFACLLILVLFRAYSRQTQPGSTPA